MGPSISLCPCRLRALFHFSKYAPPSSHRHPKSLISSAAGSFTCSNNVNNRAITRVKLIAVPTLRARSLSVSMKNGQVPAKVEDLFVCLLASSGHAKSICEILRSGSWRQARFLRDCLRVLCSLDRTTPEGLRWHREHLQLVNQMTVFLCYMWERFSLEVCSTNS